jgi:stage II sporulation protein AA (anti-sigma F factor antagonist)
MALAEQPFFDPADDLHLVAVPVLFSITTEVDGPAARMVLEGELDLSGADALRAAVDAALTEHRSVLIDLDRLEFIDSSGIVELIRAVKAAPGHGVELRLTRGGPRIRRVFELCVLDRVLPFA